MWLVGGDFHVGSPTAAANPTSALNLKLSQDHKFIVSSPENDLFPVNMKHILEVKTLSTSSDQSPVPDASEPENVTSVKGGCT